MKKNLPSPFLYASPWILSAAIGILVAIVFFFAANNLQREKRIMSENLFNKAQAIIHFIGAGSRASRMMGIPDTRQVQPLIEQASGESDIIALAIINSDGTILAHSKPNLIGSHLDHPRLNDPAMPPNGSFRLVKSETDGKTIFEVLAPFKPFLGRGQGLFKKRQMEATTRNNDPLYAPPGNPDNSMFCPPPQKSGAWTSTSRLSILVSLDMTEQAKIIRQDRYQMLSISLALLLVAIGGWIALLTAQSHRASQQTIRNMQAFTDLLISRLPVGIIATGADNRIQTFNSAASRLTGKEREQAIGQSPIEALPEIFNRLFPENPGAPASIDHELSLSEQTDEPVHLRVSSLPITDAHGIKLGRVVLLDDISGIKNLEERIRRQDRLVALGKMAAGVAHEVRNPLSSIKGFAALLGSRFSEQSEEKQAAKLLINEVERLNRSISELLTYARPQPLHLSEFAMGPFIDDSLRLVQSDAKALGVELSSRIELRQPTVVLDRDRLNQVLLNLYLNSLQAMEKGGRLTVWVGKGERPDRIEIRVRDTGYGIKKELLERVTDPYFTTKPGGSGLGLAMVHKLIDEHGGSLRISSKEGEGTTVNISLPDEHHSARPIRKIP
jgi:two-component system sensor histidine kinase HydH